RADRRRRRLEAPGAAGAHVAGAVVRGSVVEPAVRRDPVTRPTGPAHAADLTPRPALRSGGDPVVRDAVRPRQRHRWIADAGVRDEHRAGHAPSAGALSGLERGPLPRSRAGEDPARVAHRRARTSETGAAEPGV